MFLDYILDICFTMVCHSFHDWSLMSQVSKLWYKKSQQRINYKDIVCRTVPKNINESNIKFIEKASFLEKRRQSDYDDCSVTIFILKLKQLRSLKINMSLMSQLIVFDPVTHMHLKHLELNHLFLSKTEIQSVASVLSLEILTLRAVKGVSSRFLDVLSNLPNLTTFFLISTDIRKEHTYEFQRNHPWKRLRTLIIYETNIHKQDLMFLCQAQELTHLLINHPQMGFDTDEENSFIHEIDFFTLHLTKLEFLFIKLHSTPNYYRQQLEELWFNVDHTKNVDILVDVLTRLFPNMLSHH